MAPKVSVVLPTYNSSQTVTEAIDSVLAQTFRDFELIVVDDGSTDDTQERLRPYMDNDQMKYIYQANQERSMSRNNGMKQSNSQYIAFLDADDTWHPRKLATQIELLERESDTALVYSDLAYLDGQGNQLHETPPHETDHDWSGAMVFHELVLGNFIGTPSSVVIRRSSMPSEGFDPGLRQGEDWHLWLKIAALHKVARIPEALCGFRVYSGSYAQRVNNRGGREAHLKIVDALYKQLGRERFSQELYQKAYSRALFDGALIDIALHRYSDAQKRLLEAYSYDKHFFVFDGEWQASLISFAEMLDQTETPLSETKEFIDGFFETLPSPLSDCGRVRNKVISNVFISRIFKSQYRHFNEQSITTYIQAARYNPAWLLNRGFLSLGIKQVFRSA